MTTYNDEDLDWFEAGDSLNFPDPLESDQLLHIVEVDAGNEDSEEIAQSLFADRIYIQLEANSNPAIEERRDWDGELIFSAPTSTLLSDYVTSCFENKFVYPFSFRKIRSLFHALLEAHGVAPPSYGSIGKTGRFGCHFRITGREAAKHVGEILLQSGFDVSCYITKEAKKPLYTISVADLLPLEMGEKFMGVGCFENLYTEPTHAPRAISMSMSSQSNKDKAVKKELFEAEGKFLENVDGAAQQTDRTSSWAPEIQDFADLVALLHPGQRIPEARAQKSISNLKFHANRLLKGVETLSLDLLLEKGMARARIQLPDVASSYEGTTAMFVISCMECVVIEAILYGCKRDALIEAGFSFFVLNGHAGLAVSVDAFVSRDVLPFDGETEKNLIEIADGQQEEPGETFRALLSQNHYSRPDSFYEAVARHIDSDRRAEFLSTDPFTEKVKGAEKTVVKTQERRTNKGSQALPVQNHNARVIQLLPDDLAIFDGDDTPLEHRKAIQVLCKALFAALSPDREIIFDVRLLLKKNAVRIVFGSALDHKTYSKSSKKFFRQLGFSVSQDAQKDISFIVNLLQLEGTLNLFTIAELLKVNVS